MLVSEELTSDSVVSCTYREVLYILLVVDMTTKPESIMYLSACEPGQRRVLACQRQSLQQAGNRQAPHRSSSENSPPGCEEKDMRCAASPRSARLKW